MNFNKVPAMTWTAADDFMRRIKSAIERHNIPVTVVQPDVGGPYIIRRGGSGPNIQLFVNERDSTVALTFVTWPYSEYRPSETVPYSDQSIPRLVDAVITWLRFQRHAKHDK